VPTRDRLYEVIALWPKDNFVSLSIKPIIYHETMSRSIFHFTLGGNDAVYGDRCPGLWIAGYNLLLLTGVSGNMNKQVYYGPIPMNVFSHFYYEQRFDATTQKYVIKVSINNTVVTEMVNNDARDFQNVKAYFGNPWYLPADIITKDFKFGTLF